MNTAGGLHILNCPINITQQAPKYSDSDIRVVFVNEAVAPLKTAAIIAHGFYCRNLVNKEAYRLSDVGFNKAGSVLLRQKSCAAPWVATIPVGAAKDEASYSLALNEGMFGSMVLGSWLDKRKAAVKVEVLCPKKGALSLLCAIAEYRQNGGPSLPVTFYFDPSRCSKKDPKDFLDALKSGHYAAGAYPFTKRQLRIGHLMYKPQWYFSG